MPEPINLPEANGPPNARQPELEAELGRLRGLVQTLTTERDELRQELERVRAKAEDYRLGLCGLMEDLFPRTKEELAEMVANSASFDELMAELDRVEGT